MGLDSKSGSLPYLDSARPTQKQAGFFQSWRPLAHKSQQLSPMPVTHDG
jgi:hypothetical protein